MVRPSFKCVLSKRKKETKSPRTVKIRSRVSSPGNDLFPPLGPLYSAIYVVCNGVDGESYIFFFPPPSSVFSLFMDLEAPRYR